LKYRYSCMIDVWCRYVLGGPDPFLFIKAGGQESGPGGKSNYYMQPDPAHSTIVRQ